MSSYPMNEREFTSSGMSGTSVFVAFLCGAAVGAVAALLTTPKTGTEMRATLRDWAKSFNDGEGHEKEGRTSMSESTSRNRPMGTYDRPAGT